MIPCFSLSLLETSWLLFSARSKFQFLFPPFFLRAQSQLSSGQSPTLSGQQSPRLDSKHRSSEPIHWSSSSPDSPILPTGVMELGPQKGSQLGAVESLWS